MSLDEYATLPGLLSEAAASMPRPTRARDITGGGVVEFDFVTEGVGLPNPFYESGGPWKLAPGCSARCCSTKGSWWDRPPYGGSLAECVARTADTHRRLLEEQIAMGHVDADLLDEQQAGETWKLRAERAEVVLRRYGGHTRACLIVLDDYHQAPRIGCTCGFDAAVERFRG